MKKDEINIEIRKMIEILSSPIVGQYPTDTQIEKLSHLFYERDKRDDRKFDFECEAVRRGIVQGMKLMRQICEQL